MTTDIQKILWKIKLFQGVLFDHENNNNNREKEEEENLKKKKQREKCMWEATIIILDIEFSIWQSPGM